MYERLIAYSLKQNEINKFIADKTVKLIFILHFYQCLHKLELMNSNNLTIIGFVHSKRGNDARIGSNIRKIRSGKLIGLFAIFVSYLTSNKLYHSVDYKNR